MKVYHFDHCGKISPGPCTMLDGIDVLVPWHHNWASLEYWVMTAPIWLTIYVAVLVFRSRAIWWPGLNQNSQSGQSKEMR